MSIESMPPKCPGSHRKPLETSTCPVCDFTWVHVKFKKVTPTHGVVSEAQWKKVTEWAQMRVENAV